jgi:hypothetical protein
MPPGVSDQEILAVAGKWGGKVLGVEAERLPPPYEEIKTFVRCIRIQFQLQSDEKVPISIRLSGLSATVQLEGRQKSVTDANRQVISKRKRSYASAVASTPIVTLGEKRQTS